MLMKELIHVVLEESDFPNPSKMLLIAPFGMRESENEVFQ